MEGKLIGHPVLGALIIENEAQKGAYPLEKVRQLHDILILKGAEQNHSPNMLHFAKAFPLMAM